MISTVFTNSTKFGSEKFRPSASFLLYTRCADRTTDRLAIFNATAVSSRAAAAAADNLIK